LEAFSLLKNIDETIWDAEQELCFFSIVDIVAGLTDSVNPTDYLKKLRKRDLELGAYIGTNCPQVNMLTNGKKRKTSLARNNNLFEIKEPQNVYFEILNSCF